MTGDYFSMEKGLRHISHVQYAFECAFTFSSENKNKSHLIKLQVMH